MRKFIILLTVLATTGLSAGCNTFKGFGRDIERGGEKIEGAATRSQSDSR